jgi:hypothetical protein
MKIHDIESVGPIELSDEEYIKDENGNKQLLFNTVTSAVNNFSISNALSGTDPILGAEGDDTNIGLNLLPKGTGTLSISGTSNYENNVTDDDDIPNKKYIDPLAPQYNTIYIDAGAMIECTTNPAETGTNEYVTNDVDFDYFAFDGGATEERVQFKLVMPENWDRSTIKVKFQWSSATSSTTGDTVEWGIKAGALANDDAIDQALGTPQVITDALLADNGTDLQITSATPALTIVGTPALGEIIAFEIYRNTDGTDDMAEDAWLFGCLIQYKLTNTVAAW